MSPLSPSALARLVSMSITIAVFLISTANIASSTQTRVLKVSYPNIWYGGVVVGQSATHTIALTNTGSASVMAGMTERKQALHDIMAGCLVLRACAARPHTPRTAGAAHEATTEDDWTV